MFNFESLITKTFPSELWSQVDAHSRVGYLKEIVKDFSLLMEHSRAVIARDTNEPVDRDEGSVDGPPTISTISSQEGDSEDEEPGFIHEIDFNIQCLMDLAPVIDSNLVLVERKSQNGNDPSLSAFSVSKPAWIYVSYVRDKYKFAATRLVERLGESNWQRYLVVRSRMDHCAEMFGTEFPVPETKETILSAFKPLSIFHDSALGTTISAASQYAASAASHTSYLSSLAQQEDSSVQVPATPTEVGTGKPFRCFICGLIQAKIKNRIDWK